MKLQVLADERFTCRSCTTCCRNWFVELMPGEEEKVRALDWPAEDPIASAEKVIRHAGKTFLARRADGACLFLNETNGLCRIHERFGFGAKPLGCRVFPYQIAPTFKGEASVIGRYDCPAVRRNEGALHADELPMLRGFVQQMDVESEGFDETTACHLTKEQIQAVTDFVATLMAGFPTNEGRTLFIAYLCDVLAHTDVNELSREALGEAFSGLKRVVENALAVPARRPNWFARMAFRALLGLYLRRDEDVLTKRAGRVGRMAGLAWLIGGFGTFRSLGVAHRPGRLRKARLFKPGISAGDATTYALFWRMVRNRLDAFQFMGPANNGRDFLSGLRSLALLYPLVAAVAKFSAANRGARAVETEDVDYAVTVIEHSFGRLPILNQRMTGPIERLLTEGGRFAQVVRTI